MIYHEKRMSGKHVAHWLNSQIMYRDREDGTGYIDLLDVTVLREFDCFKVGDTISVLTVRYE